MRASGGVLMDRGATTIPSSSGSAAMALKELDASAAEASRLRSVGSSSSLSSTVYEDDADTPVPSTATAAAPPATTATPTLGFEPSNFFRFADFGTNAARGRDDFFAAQELLDNNEMLPPQTASPTNQATHEDADDAEAADIVAPTPTLPRSITHPRVSRRKNSIEMFLSQSPSQALGGGFLKMALDDDDHHAPNQPLPPPPDLDLRLDGSDAAVKAGAAAAGRPSHQVGAAPYGYLLSHSPPAVDTDDEWSSTSSQEMLSSSSASTSAYYYTASQAALHQQSYAGYGGGAAEPFAAYGGSEAYSAREPHHHSQSWNATAGYGSLAPPYQHASTGPSLARYAPMHPPYHPQQQQQQGYQQGHRGHRGHGYARSQSMYATPSSRGMMDVPAYGAKQCKFFLQGHCRMGNKCKFAHHTPGHPVSAPLHHAQSFRLAQPSPASSPHHHHQQGDYDAAPPPAFLAPRGGATRASYRSDHHHHQSHHSQAPPPPTAAAAGSSPAAMLDETLTVDDVHGRVFAMSKDQNGCRLLQEQLEFYDERKPLCDLIYAEAMDHLAEMMVDPFGNYLFQKLLERARPLQRLEMVRRVGSHLVAAALNLHGTRSVQKVVEVCATSAQVVELDSDGRESRRVHLPDLLVAALQDDAVRLCIDSNGNHVIQRALQFMKPEYNQFVFDAVAKECTTVGTHRHGCCVLQRCLDAANGQQKREVITQVEKQAMKLMQDPYGNYVVQYVLDSCTAEEAYGVMSKPLGSVFELSIQKFSSNVIEKCLEKAPPALLQQYVEEITLCAKMQKMLQDQFANYVVQRALSVAAEDQCLLLVKAIRPHLPAMKNTSGGRRITARILKRFPLMDLSLDLGFDAYSMSSYGQELHHPQHHQPPHHHQQPQYQSYQAAQQHFQYGAAPYGMMRSDRSDDGMPRM